MTLLRPLAIALALTVAAAPALAQQQRVYQWKDANGVTHYADVAPQHIHHNADQIEHVIEPNIVNELEELLAGREGAALVPADPEKPRAVANGGMAI